MKNILIKIVVLFFVFITAFLIFSGFNTTKYHIKQLENASLPIVWIEEEYGVYNYLHGYTQNIESITEPYILTKNNKLSLSIKENGNTVSKISYKLYNEDNVLLIEEQIGKDSITKTDNEVKVNMEINRRLIQDYTYRLVIAVTTKNRETIYYYGSLINNNIHNMGRALDIIHSIHNSTFEKEEDHLKETLFKNRQEKNEEVLDLGNVNLDSSMTSILWSDLNVHKMNEPKPILMGMDRRMLYFEMNYVVLILNDNMNYYYVKEEYKVELGENGHYNIVDFTRTLRKRLDNNLIDIQNNQINLGYLKSQMSINMKNSPNGRYIVLSDKTQLWLYDRTDNKVIEVFNFDRLNNEFILDTYDRHEIKPINVDNSGNITYGVKGYMNSGVYEGQNGVLINYYNNENYYNETVSFVSIEDSYDVLINNIIFFDYLNENNECFFVYNNKVYAIDIENNKYTVVYEDLPMDKDRVFISRNNSFIAWQQDSFEDTNDEIFIIDLKTKEKHSLKSNNGEKVKILGLIRNNLVVGYANESNISQGPNGKTVFPMERVDILDEKKEVLKTYIPKPDSYVKGYEFSNNRINFFIGKIVNNNNNIYLEQTEIDFITHIVTNGLVPSNYSIESMLEENRIKYVINVNIPQNKPLSYMIANQKISR
ncbi:hypothetical protein EDC18_10936 [Natranaerovirga pectinivora]|uniref:Uncharacterized protein n=1 Tax=Natranaerovirga pectinivora TaxID=682400 RepID=A0A4R3MIC5_9FIRM|nr:hypothetical protein [Natranaerovirga pectinivora]TCT13073.1 hypothetical protein EDC18_10936 [Natranaerovirga pectinivora]